MPKIVIAPEFITKVLTDQGLTDWQVKIAYHREVSNNLGMCAWHTKIIWVRASRRTEQKHRNTLLHEVAHALTPGARHNKPWIQKFTELQQQYWDASVRGYN